MRLIRFSLATTFAFVYFPIVLSAADSTNCVVQSLAKNPVQGFKVTSPDGSRYVLNNLDASGTAQIYIGNTGSTNLTCLTCTQVPGGPKVERFKMQPRWHPSGKWIILAIERDQYDPGLVALGGRPAIIGQLQNGVWTNMWAVTPDGQQWFQLTNFQSDTPGVGDGYTGPALTPDGKTAVWSQAMGDIATNYPFGRWELTQADFVDTNGIPSLKNLKNITPTGMNWNEPGNFSPDGATLVLTGSTNSAEQEGMDQYSLNIKTGQLANLTNSPTVWDEHGVFSPDGEKILFMSAYPYRDDPNASKIWTIKAEFMLMNKDGSGLTQLTHYRTPGFPESGDQGIAANGDWSSDGRSLVLRQLYFPDYVDWTLTFAGPCGNSPIVLPPPVGGGSILNLYSDQGFPSGAGSMGSVDGSATFFPSSADIVPPEGLLSWKTVLPTTAAAYWGYVWPATQNMSRFNTGELRFWVRASRGDIRVEIKKGTGASSVTIKSWSFSDLGWTSVKSDQWVLLRAPLAGLDLSAVDIPFDFLAPSGPTTFYIDHVRYVDSTAMPFFALSLHNRADHSIATSQQLTWTLGANSTGWTMADQYLQLEVDMDAPAWGLQLYTNNTTPGADPVFHSLVATGQPGSNPAGLVDTALRTRSLSMAWAIRASSAAISPTAGDPNDTTTNPFPWSYLQDRATPAIPAENTTAFSDGLTQNIIQNNRGIHDGPAASAWDISSPVNSLYFEANFSDALAQKSYKTSALTLELFTP